MSSAAIGIFDSGIGGLTVLREIQKKLPKENIVYLGDTARVPYGTKSAETVTLYSMHNVNFLLQKNVKMIVVACNTASAFALPSLQKKYSLPILGVIEPGSEVAIQKTKSGHIGVIGTEGTIRSQAYQNTLSKLRSDLQISATACPLFVPLAEEGWITGEVPEKIAATYFEKLKQAIHTIDTLILGCTHYPLLKSTIQKVVGPEVVLIDSAEATAFYTEKILKEKNLLNTVLENGKVSFYVTDSAEKFKNVGELFLKQHISEVEHVSIGTT
ncbi:MAG: glutamate racemase [Deltaproteobacteria bacterium]|nr:MAG: glutamate racemase [Deltaproteobacteria bacterium]